MLTGATVCLAVVKSLVHERVRTASWHRCGRIPNGTTTLTSLSREHQFLGENTAPEESVSCVQRSLTVRDVTGNVRGH